MTKEIHKNIKTRLKEIGNRKIEILQEVAYINEYYNERISGLNTEYKKLDIENYYLQLDLIRKIKRCKNDQ